jgi:hypothetical protein
MEESSEQKYDRLQRELQNAILKGFPNPERKGCPGRAVVESYAKNPDQITVADDVNTESKWYHITHCSPCYAEFLELRTAYRVKRVRARFTRRTAILSSLVATGAAGWLLSRNRTRTVDIDFEKYMSTRGVEDRVGQSLPTIPTGKVQLRLRLPKDSAGGLYSVRLSKDSDSTPVFSTTATAVLRDGSQMIEFDANTGEIPGSFTLAVRSDHRGVWRYCPVTIQAR